MTTRIRRERHRPLWQRTGVIAVLLAIALGLGVVGAAWHLGGPVPVRAVAVALPDINVGVASAAASGEIGR